MITSVTSAFLAFLVVVLPSVVVGSVSAIPANGQHNAAMRIVPSIVALPPPVTYFDRSRPELTLTCEVWPPTADISFFISHPTVSAAANRFPLSLNPIVTSSSSSSPSEGFTVSRRVLTPSNISTDGRVPAFSNVAVSVSLAERREWEKSDLWQFHSVDVHCSAITQFGSVLSAPFRVAETRLAEFPSSSSSSSNFIKTRVEEFIKGNLAFVSCPIPPGSLPTPIVRFHLNGTLVVTNFLINGKEKYKQVRRPNEDQVLLLINNFKVSDEGDYRCELINPITGRSAMSPEIVRLQVRAPDKPVPVRSLLTLAPQGNNSMASTSRQISVREGDNVTLFCILEGAPPPEVHTYPHKSHNYQGTYARNQDFGLLQLVNVGLFDEGIYLCSTEHLSFTAALKVKPRLRLTQSPLDVRLHSLGQQAEFLCSVTDPYVTPFWLFNGRPINTLTPEKLVIASVKLSDLGAYQCIARTLTADGRTDEWVSATALLSLYSDKVIKTAADLVEFIPNAHRTSNHQEVITTTKEMTPLAEMALDNFAVYLVWKLSDTTLYAGHRGGGNSLALSSQLQQMKMQQVAYQIDYSTLVRESLLNPALVNLIPPEPAVWSEAERLNTMWRHKYSFIIGHPLEPGKTYRFRVRAVSMETGMDLIPPSDWSEPVSTHHISNAPPPRITSIQPYHDGRFNVTWEYDGSVGGQRFKPDFFLVIARPILRSAPTSTNEHSGPLTKTTGDEVVHYGRYRATQVNGSDSREAFIYNLNTSVSYQLVVYGVKYDNGVRRITRFSEAKFATLPEVPGFGAFSLIRAVTENKPIFTGLGILALIIFLIVLVLVITCIARQRKYRRRRRVKHDGFLTGHADSEKYQSQSQQHAQQQNQQSTAPADPRTISPSVKAAQAQANPQQQQFAQQQAAYMGSAMHLGSYYGNYHYPGQNHHQSHHSLLLPGTGVPGMMVSPMIQSGTLPPGMRSSGMMHQQSHYLQSSPQPQPPQAQMGGFGSHQMDSMEQASLMRDYYQQQQQFYHQHLLNQQQQNQQASFMYATNNPIAYLPPTQQQQQQQQMMDTLSSRQNNKGYVCGSSIHSGASLKRDPSESFHDDATLLARSPMSPHPPPMLGDQIPPPGYFQTPMYHQQHPLMSPPAPPVQLSGAAYYPGQLTSDAVHMAMHNMGPHTDGESIYSYYSQQDVCHPKSHGLLNPLPEENQMNPAYAESGSQTAGMNGTNGTAGSPPGGVAGGHRHHRRRRRKQQQQAQSSGRHYDGCGESDGFQYPGHGGEHIEMMSMMEAPGRMATTSGFNGLTPPSAAGLEQAGGNEVMNHLENLRSGNQSFDRSTPSYGASSGVGVRSPLPPPCQPPPPPPPAMMMMQMTASGGLDNNAVSSSSLNRRGGGGGVLSGPPPRIRDYSEYGIPTSTPNTTGGPIPHGVVSLSPVAPTDPPHPSLRDKQIDQRN